jgi:hypothetical protein
MTRDDEFDWFPEDAGEGDLWRGITLAAQWLGRMHSTVARWLLLHAHPGVKSLS